MWVQLLWCLHFLRHFSSQRLNSNTLTEMMAQICYEDFFFLSLLPFQLWFPHPPTYTEKRSSHQSWSQACQQHQTLGAVTLAKGAAEPNVTNHFTKTFPPPPPSLSHTYIAGCWRCSFSPLTLKFDLILLLASLPSLPRFFCFSQAGLKTLQS